jgi:hypothetical protein
VDVRPQPFGGDWKTGPDRHSSGTLSASNLSTGYFHLSEKRSSERSRRPATAAKRAERLEEDVCLGACIRFKPQGPIHLEHIASREAVRLGQFSGYAVLFRYTMKHWEDEAKAPDKYSIVQNSLLVMDLTDRCAELDVTLLARLRRDEDQWFPLDSLLQAITINKTASAEAQVPRGDGWVVRPRRPGEQPAYRYSKPL